MRGFKRTLPSNLTFVGHFKKIQNYKNIQTTIRQELMKLTSNHCSYCDCIFKMAQYTPEIEHFIPKRERPSLESAWFNLFISCPKCNSNKLGKYPDIKPLKPDSINYNFDYWFSINFDKGTLLPNPSRTNLEKKRVEITINWFGLNHNYICVARLEELKNFNDSSKFPKNILEWSYSYFLERS